MDTISKPYPLYDMHCHILPGIDDGSSDLQESAKMLYQASCQGVRAIVCTPHYYPKESVQDFLTRRNEARRSLESAIPSLQEQFPVPTLYYGAEVAYYSGISRQEDFNLLKIEGTNYLLLELPFAVWSPTMFRELEEIQYSQGIQLIIAHLERYLSIEKKKTISQLLEMDVLIQMNGECLLEGKHVHAAKSMLKKGQVHLLGSDSHGASQRPQTLGTAAQKMEKWKMIPILEDIACTSEMILREG